MNRITTLFRGKPKGILSVFFTAGFPHADSTNEVLLALQNGGIDLVEIGIPFSDPVADGTVIQNASAKALQGGMSLKKLFEQLKNVRNQIDIPLILMGYLNPVMQYGAEAFFAKCAEVGIDGVILPDLPPEIYIREYKTIAERHGICVIPLITPETSDERIRLIDAHTNGFIYMVSSAGTTGAQSRFDEATESYFRRVSEMNLRNPLLIGFGISNKTTLETAQKYVNGAIIGSKFVSLLAESVSADEAVSRLRDALR